MVDDREYGADEELISNALKLRYTEAVSVAGSGVFLTDASERELLDFEAGGQVSVNLRNLYNYMTKRLMLANTRQDTKIIQEVIGLLDELNRGWKAIAK